MGFYFKGTTYRLQFTDGRFKGLEVDCRAGSPEQYEALETLDEPGLSKGAVYRRMCAAFAASLETWNVEDRHGVAVPATLEGLMTQDIVLVNAICQAWLDAVLAEKQQESATADDREQAALLAELQHEIIDHPV